MESLNVTGHAVQPLPPVKREPESWRDQVFSQLGQWGLELELCSFLKGTNWWEGRGRDGLAPLQREKREGEPWESVRFIQLGKRHCIELRWWDTPTLSPQREISPRVPLHFLSAGVTSKEPGWVLCATSHGPSRSGCFSPSHTHGFTSHHSWIRQNFLRTCFIEMWLT